MTINEPLEIDGSPRADLTGVIGYQELPAQALTKGTVTTWTSATRRGTVTVHGTAIPDMSALDVASLSTLAVGDVVLVVKMGKSWLIGPRILDPI